MIYVKDCRNAFGIEIGIYCIFFAVYVFFDEEFGSTYDKFGELCARLGKVLFNVCNRILPFGIVVDDIYTNAQESD